MALFIEAIDTIGAEPVATALKAAMSGDVCFDNPLVELVVTTVARKTEIPVCEIINGSGRRNDRRFAIGFCAFYLKDIYHFTPEQIETYLKKDISICSKYAKAVRTLSPKLITDKKYIEYKEYLDKVLVK